MITAVIQARLGSKRLPQKALLPIDNTPIVDLIAKRALISKNTTHVCLSTSNSPEDDKLEAFFRSKGYLTSRHEVDDIIGRLHKASLLTSNKYILRLWGDSPFICPEIIDEAIEKVIVEKLDFFSTAYPSLTFPGGLDFEIYTKELLYKINKSCSDAFYREFPFEFIKDNLNNIRAGGIHLENNYTKYELVIDYPEDLQLSSKVYGDLKKISPNFSLDHIIRYILENKQLFDSTDKLKRNIEYKEKLNAFKN